MVKGPTTLIHKALLLLGCIVWFALETQATILVVDDLGDVTPTTGNLTLRQAVASAATSDTIIFKLPTSPATITLSAGAIDIDKSLFIVGPGARHLTLDAAGSGRIFNITAPNVTILGFTLINGIEPSGGGNIFVAATATDCRIEECAIRQGDGGTSGGGGAILTQSPSLLIEGCEISNNQAAQGGGIEMEGGQLTLINTTISGNTANVFNGGGIHIINTSVLLSNYNTIFDNRAVSGMGGGVFDEFAAGTYNNTIIGGNTAASGTDLWTNGTSPVGNYNLLTDDSPVSFTGTGNITGNPDVDALSYNGRQVQTHRLISSSPCIDAGNPSHTGEPSQDGRGAPRQLASSLTASTARSDIGAFEFTPATVINNIGFNAFGSLNRWIQLVNAATAPGPFYIEFNVVISPVEINLIGTALTAITKPNVIIDGFSQTEAYPPSYNQPGVVAVQVAATSTSTNGVEISAGADGCEIRGLSIIGFAGFGTRAGLTIQADNCRIEGCYIGLESDGTGEGINDLGVVVSGAASNNRIGGDFYTARNVITNNTNAQVRLESSGSNNQVLGNYLGTVASGNAGTSAGGASIGIEVKGGSNNDLGGNGVFRR